ncbi:polysaccharide lyase beta-sandwich domain-containing protein [Paraflavitalea speifideaquila]|uniref:polysaccharide lyase beta-sandwich domain-containing protein n=1 Tax=Paraflavitalea speifideaquila TaxID=3076558 RepID=UPI003CCDD8A1
MVPNINATAAKNTVEKAGKDIGQYPSAASRTTYWPGNNGDRFYQPGTIKISNQLTLTTNQPCIVMLKAKGAAVTSLLVTDPTQKLSALQLKVNDRTIEVSLPTGVKPGVPLLYLNNGNIFAYCEACQNT